MKKLSLVMITKNEEDKLRRCLDSVKDIVDEIIIVDTGSTDSTKDIAFEYTDCVYDYVWDDNFSNARNYAIDKSTGDWNLILDADEYITEIDIEALNNIMNNSKIIGQVKIISFYEEDNEIKNSSSFISRFAPKNSYFEGAIHEQLQGSYPIYKLPLVLEHDGYLNTNKFDRNIHLLLSELENNPTDSYLLYQTAKTYYSSKMYHEASPYFDRFYEYLNYDTDAFAESALVTYIYNTIKLKDFDKGFKIINDNFDKLSMYSDFYFACGVFFTELIAYDTNKYINYFDNIELSYLNALNVGENDNFNGVEGTGSFLAAFNLGTFYEISGNVNKAIEYYEISAKYDYNKAVKSLNRLKVLVKE